MTATVKGGLFAQYSDTLTQINNTSSLRRKIAQALGKRTNFSLRQIMRTLNGAAPGSNATKTLTRIEANQELGGNRTIETETLVNRNTTAGDVQFVNDVLLSLTSQTRTTNPPNLDGNPLGTR